MYRPCNLAANIIKETEERTGRKIRILDIGGGFPVKYHPGIKTLTPLAKKLTAEIGRLFPADMQILAEPGRFLVANTCTLVAKVIGKAIPRREALLLHQRWGIPHVFGPGLRPLHLPCPVVQG